MRIRKPKRASTIELRHEAAEQPDYTVPPFVAKQLLMLMRMTHKAGLEMGRIAAVLPADQAARYAHLANIDLRPSFVDVMSLIDISEQHGLLTLDEAASVRAGRCIENPVPESERSGPTHPVKEPL